MSRSLKKGPYINVKLEKKVNNGGNPLYEIVCHVIWTRPMVRTTATYAERRKYLKRNSPSIRTSSSSRITTWPNPRKAVPKKPPINTEVWYCWNLERMMSQKGKKNGATTSKKVACAKQNARKKEMLTSNALIFFMLPSFKSS